MGNLLLNTADLPEALSKLVSTEKVEARKVANKIHLRPIQENPVNYIRATRGSLSKYPERTVDKFLEIKHRQRT
jgi:hypothetical protein